MEATVRARISLETKEKATHALASMGLSMSDAIRIFLIRVADEKCLPFQVKVPNAKTKAAIEDAKAGRVYTINSFEEFLEEIDAEIEEENRSIR